MKFDLGRYAARVLFIMSYLVFAAVTFAETGYAKGKGNGYGRGHNKPSPTPSPSPSPTPSASPSPTPVADVQAPSKPGDLLVVVQGYQTAYLRWPASTDNVGVAGYHLYRDGNLIQTLVHTAVINEGLIASTSYAYSVSAFDAAGNESENSNILNYETLSAPVPLSEILSTAKHLIDAFSQVQELAEFAVNGRQYPTYGGCSGGYCTSAQYEFLRGPKTVLIKESGLDPAFVSMGMRETQFNLSMESSALYLTLGGSDEYRMTFGNNDHSSPVPYNADSVSLSYQTNINRNEVQELVLVISNIDGPGQNIGVEVSDGVNTASLLLGRLTGFASQRQLGFPLAAMAGIGNLSSVITHVKLTLYSGTYGLDAGYSVFIAR